MNRQSASNSPPDRSQQVYAYLCGTVHLVPWAWMLVGVGWMWLTHFTHGADTLRLQHGRILLLFGLGFILLGGYIEWTQRNEPGRVVIDAGGLRCTLPWGRHRHWRWDEIREVRCITRRFHRDFAFWEIRGPQPEDRLNISWQLTGYKDLLRTIQSRATRCERFDAID